MRVLAPITGTSREVRDMPDPVFASGLVGAGLAIEPRPGEQTAVAPIAGVLRKLFAHAYLVVSDDGPAVLVHLGIDTVQMHGDGFTLLATEAEHVEAGQDIVRWNPGFVAGTGRSPICAVVVLDCPGVPEPQQSPGSVVTVGRPVFDVRW